MEHSKNVSGRQGRLSFLAALGGFLVLAAFLNLFMSLAAGLGLWTYRMPEAVMTYQNFWTVASFVWVGSVGIGCYIAALAAPSTRVLSGILNALTTWACAFIFIGGVSIRMADPSNYAFEGGPSTGIFWQGFLADAAGFLVAILAGILGTLTKKVKFRVEEKQDVLESSTALLN